MKPPVLIGTAGVIAAMGLALPASAAPRRTSLEPAPVVRLSKRPYAVFPKGDAEKQGPAPKEAAHLATKRFSLLAQRDTFAVPGENLRALPRQFCVQNRCYGTYREVAAALYPSSSGSDKLTVFCAPRRLPGVSKFDPKDPLRSWETDKVHCSRDWADTLGWVPWLPSGEPAPAAEQGRIPPYSCFGNPHLLLRHMILTPGGVAGTSGFVCRKRIFRVMVKKAEQSRSDQARNIAQMCTEMRQQVWGEKYPDINSEYQKWCRSRGKEYCLPSDVAATGMPGATALPFMYLSREELLFFYGHRETYCRADRKGLTHFLYNKVWAKTFTCGLARGVLEAGPFEEGVQVCALAPYYGERAPRAKLRDPFKARLHCWKFNRPTCEEISRDQTKDDIHRSNVFDAFDSLREFRRTRRRNVFRLYDLKDAEKLADFSEGIAFADTGKDEGIFGVKEFCRFVGDLKTIQCGYRKASIARWYQLRRLERPAGCGAGVCERGAYRRGYLCGLFASKEMFDGKPYWMCGLDVGRAGRRRLRTARAICLGGKAASRFQSAKGDRSSLQCYERRFRWAESSASKQILRALSWPKLVEKAGKRVRADPHFKRVLTAADVDALVVWSGAYGHTFGHRTSLRIGLFRSKVPAVLALHKLNKRKITKITNTKELSAKEVKDKLKSLNELIAEVVSGERPPDAKWWHELYAEANEGRLLRIAPGELNTARRIQALVRVLDLARGDLLDVARRYATEVLARARQEGLLSRLEVHERMRGDVMDAGHKGTIYCIRENAVSEAAARSVKRTQGNYVCASSALLAAGMVELVVRGRKAEFRPLDGTSAADHPRQYEQFKQTLRGQVKSEWCYGSSAASPLYGPRASPALFGLDLSSPYLMEVSRGVIDLEKAALNRNQQRKWVSSTNWLKCAGFQYSDEHWQHSVPGGGRNAPGSRVAGADRPGYRPPRTVGVGGGGAGAILKMVGGLVGKLVDLVLPGFSDVISRVRDLAHGSWAFLKEWAGKLVARAKSVWEKGKAMVKQGNIKIADLQKLFRKGQKAFADARQKAGEGLLEATQKANKVLADTQEKVSRAEVFLASAMGPAKERAAAKLQEMKDKLREAKNKAKEMVRKAKQAGKDLVTKMKKAAKDATKKFDKMKKTAAKALRGIKKANKVIHGSGELIGGLLENLTNEILGRVMAYVRPKARDLFQRGFRFVRNILGAVAKVVISALASIPFVGGAMAALGQIAYDQALNALEDWCFERLIGVVERMLAKGVRAILSPVAKVVQKQLTKLVHSACQRFGVCLEEGGLKFAALPPRDRWLKRALACRRGPLIDAKVRRRAVLARMEIIEIGERAKREAPRYARLLANQYLARYGVTLKDVLAAARGDRKMMAFVRVDQVRRALERAVGKARAALRRRP